MFEANTSKLHLRDTCFNSWQVWYLLSSHFKTLDRCDAEPLITSFVHRGGSASERHQMTHTKITFTDRLVCRFNWSMKRLFHFFPPTCLSLSIVLQHVLNGYLCWSPAGKRLGYTFDNKNFHNVSLGQGQEVIAEQALDVAAKEGHWVILQVKYCHIPL